MKEINYTIKRSKRVKRLRLTVNCDAKVIVTAPHDLSDSYILDFVQRKANWIKEKVQRALVERKEWKTPAGVTQEQYAACHARAKRHIRDRVRALNEHYGFEYGRVTIKNMKTRWGSCSGKGNLNFHYRLYFLPQEIADYVIVHELCHLAEPNHSKKFWMRVSEVVPDYDECREELSRYMIS